MRRVLFTCALLVICVSGADAQELYPKHVTAASQLAVKRGLEYLAKSQNGDGNWVNSTDGQSYPITMASLSGMAFLASGDTPSRGQYADNIQKIIQYLLSNARPSGIVTGPNEELGRPMYGHGFSMLFLSQCYGMETNERTRKEMRKVINEAILLTARGQSAAGGWTYTPGGGDEGSVTVTQIQGLRAAHNAGFTVPKGTIEMAVKYLEACRTPEGGIVYSLRTGGEARPAISAAALATLYNAGEYDSRLADDCLKYVSRVFGLNKNSWNKDTGHDFYSHLYASQAFYQAGDKYWDQYYPATRDQLIQSQQADGTWNDSGIGPVYGTAVATIILQLPYKYLPIYQR